MSAFTGMQFTEAEEPALQAIEADIEHHSKLLVGLRRRRNSFVRLNRLPPELLTEIFLYCRDEDWDLPINSETAKCRATSPCFRWIFVTAVCNHWRQLALKTPRLWSDINLQYPKFATYSLQLAKQSPLCLQTTGFSTSERSILDDVVSNDLRRVWSIWWEIPYGMNYKGEPLSAESSIVFSQLRNMFVAFGHGASNILPIFANIDFPAIQTLHLVNCVEKLPPCLLAPTLETLSLVDNRESLYILPVELTTYLSRMSQLTSIELRGIGLGRKEEIVGSQLSLPHLRKVVLQPTDNHHKSYLSLLGSLDLSPGTHLDFDFILAVNMSIEDLSSLLHIFLQHIRPLDLRTLALRNEPALGWFFIELWDDILNTEDLIRDRPYSPYTLSLPQSSQAKGPLWKMLTRVVKQSSIETIHLSYFIPRPSIEWKLQRLLRACNDVTHLSLEGPVSDAVFLKLLRQDRSDEGNPTPPPLAAPKLETIHFWGVLWPPPDFPDGSFNNLLSTLYDRAQAGHPLREIIMRRCINLSGTAITGLQERVDAVKPAMGMVKFTWDEYEEKDEEEDSESDDSDDQST